MSTRYRLTIAARVLLASLMLGLAALPLRAQEPAQGTASGTTVTEPDADAPVVLRVPWVQSPGFGGLTPDGEVSSFPADVARAVAAEIGAELVFVEYPSPARVIAAMRDGEADMLGSVGRLPALEASNLFADQVAEAHFILYVRRDAPEDWTIEAFENRRIGVVRNTAASRLTPLDGAVLVEFEDQVAAFTRLLAGDVDGVVVVHAQGDRTLRETDLDTLIRPTTPSVFTNRYFLALNRSRADLMPAIQAALDRLEASGELDELRTRWAMVPPVPVPDVLTVGVTHFPPYQVVRDDGSFTGFSVEVLRILAQRASISLQFEQISRDNWARGPRVGAFDLVPARSINAEEQQWLQFSLPVQTVDYATFVAAGSDLGIETAQDLAGLRVAMNFSSPIRARIERQIGAPVETVADVSDGVAALRDGSVDVMIFPALNVSDYLAAEGLQPEVTRLLTPVFRNQLAIAMRPGLGDLKRRLDVVIPGFLGAPEYIRLSRTWLEQPPYWTQKRLRLLAAGAAALVLLALIGFLVQNWRARRVAERLRAEAVAANERLSAIMANTRQAVFGFDAIGKIAVINPSGRALLTADTDPPPNHWPQSAEFLDPVSRAPFSAAEDPLRQALSGRLVNGLVCLFRRDRTHEPRFVRVTSDVIPDDRSALRTLLIVEDEHDNELTRQQLDRSHRLSSMGQLTGGLAHDFNNILATVLYNAELAKMMTGSTEQPLIDRIIATVRSGSDLTKRLLAFARRSPQPAKVVNLARSLKETEALARPAIGEAISFEMSPIDDDVHVHCDRSELETALLNLVLNARNAITDAGKGDRISVELRCYDLMQGTDSADATPVVEISVSDNGPGMTEEVRRRATDPFFSTRGDTGGTGLGLAMVESFVTRAEGSMSIYSEPGLGTTIRLRLPRVTAEDQPAAPADAPEIPRGAGERILLVEDQPDLREPMAQLIRGLGYTVEASASGVEAMERLRDGAAPDLVLSDIVMPGGVSGVDLARHLQKHHPDTAVILMTGFANVGAAELRDLSVEVLRKPCPVSDIAIALRDALASG